MFKPVPYAADPRVRQYIVPVRVVRVTGQVEGAENLLEPRPAQIALHRTERWPLCTLKNAGGEHASVLVDFGCEIHGSARIYITDIQTPTGRRANFRIRFGESVSEALTPLGQRGTTNAHANRDMRLTADLISANETNETGFRFLYVELEDEDTTADLYMLQGVMIGLPIQQQGSFRCSDPLINDIYDTAVYTTYLNMQEYLWDGIKRDRCVWCGDIYPAEVTILAAYGAHEILKRSLDLNSQIYPPTQWMNNIPSYSLWWLISHEILYMAGGDLTYLREKHSYMKELVQFIAGHIQPDGDVCFPRDYLDWPSSENEEGKHSAQLALLVMTFDKTAAMMRALDDEETAAFCDELRTRVMQQQPAHNGCKQAAALLGLSGLRNVKAMNAECIEPGGAHGYSTFMGYSILSAKAEADDVSGALRDMREYWGGMLKMGATTFWEDFNLEWMDNAAPITELVPEGKKDIHGDCGAYCYEQFRHSLCHAWASGPAPFLAKYVLGVKVLEPGCRKIGIQPDLGGLAWAEGDYPTPHGPVHIRVDEQGVNFTAPEGVEVVLL